ncbi:MAG TPA: hypothetical protein VGM37_15655 [Armatimonadota bacterium]|jgi:hypothetical protein
MVSHPLILDACALLNVFASGRFHDILATLDGLAHVGERARAEAQWIRAAEGEARRPVDVSEAIAGGLLFVERLSASERATFAEMAVAVDDGEAEAAAIALGRGWLLATDDRKAMRVLSAGWPRLRVLSTPELMKRWQTAAGISNAEMAAILRAVSYRASFAPRRDDPQREWWLDLMER